MSKRNLYTADEVAQFCEAYRRFYNKEENKGKYYQFVSLDVQKSIADLVKLGWDFYDPQKKDQAKNSEEFKRFKEFFEIYKSKD